MTESRSEGSGETVESYVERFLERLDSGKPLSPEALAAEAPEELRDEVRERCQDVEFVRQALPALGPGSLVGEPPRVLGDFRLLKRIGQGGMGVVYLARQVSLDREVAVKVLPPLTMTARQIERFRREARAAAKLAHKNIVPVHVVGEVEGTHFFAMDFVRGRSLHEELALSGRHGSTEAQPILPRFASPEWIPRVAAIVADLASALQCAHSAGIVHRDVKPHNVLLDRSGTPHLVDFGLARDESQGTLTATGDLAGTPYYMSPEQARAQKHPVDHRTDVYSLGVVLYELLTLRHPFEGRTSREILERITTHEPASIREAHPGVPEDLETICRVAMAKEPNQRYATAAEFEADLRRFLRGEPIAATPPSLLSRWRWRMARRPALAGAALAGVLALAGGWSAREILGGSPGDDWPRLSLEVADWAPQSDGARVWLTPFTSPDAFGPSIELGRLPLEDVPVAPGRYRLVASGPEEEAFSELDLSVEREPARRTLQVGLRPAPDLRGMRRVAASSFPAGNEHEPAGGSYGPRRAELPAYWIDELVTTNAQYRAYWLATGRRAPVPAYWPDPWDPALDDLPLTQLSLPDLERYAQWAGKRVQTSLEWERAARGTDGRRHPAGDTPPELPPSWFGTYTPEESALETYRRLVLPARQKQVASMRGVEGIVLTNVAEWTATPYVEPSGSGPAQPGPWFCLRGTSFAEEEPLPLDGGLAIHAAMKQVWLGVRLVRSVRPTVIPEE